MSYANPDDYYKPTFGPGVGKLFNSFQEWLAWDQDYHQKELDKMLKKQAEEEEYVKKEMAKRKEKFDKSWEPLKKKC